jgi:succinylarginine dihydrolase
MREYNFDGIVGPTHNYAGLAAGNVASVTHGGQPSNPREAALEGLRKMRFVRGLGVSQAVLPPHPRPSVATLRQLGLRGSDEEVLARAAADHEQLLRLCSSAAAMWTANAATVAPSADTSDGRVHIVPANLQAMFHRAIEAPVTTAVLRAIFADSTRFVVHDALPGGGQLADEGAANHTRLKTSRGVAHLFAWGRTSYGQAPAPARHPARQTLEGSQAIARLFGTAPKANLFPQQAPAGIDAGAFHTDVLAVGHGSFLMLHERAFLDWPAWEKQLRSTLGDELSIERASDSELPVQDAVAAYPFNSQVVTVADGGMAIIAPADAQRNPRTRAFLDRVVAGSNPVRAVHYLDIRQSMDNGGGPACLRLRVGLTEAEVGAIRPRVFADEALLTQLDAWVRRHYRDRLVAKDLGDPLLWREGMTALDELTGILRLGVVYDFQRS